MCKQSGYRIMPLTIRQEIISDEGDFIMNEIKLIKNKPFSYLIYAYLQQISNSDVDTRTTYRKVYIDNISSRTISRNIKLSQNKILSSIKYLEREGFLSQEVYEDFYGKYKKLYVLDCRHYVKLDFSDKRIEKLIKCIKETGLRLYLIYRYFCHLNGECYLTMEQLCEWLGLSDSGDNRKTISLFNEVLHDIGLIEIQQKAYGKYKNKNVYRCL